MARGAVLPGSDPAAVARAAQALRAGGLVAIPTETVYGLAADATRPEAVARIFAAKERPHFNPLIAHLPSREAAGREGIFDARARALAAACWPGPLTLVVPAAATGTVCDLARAGLASVALRVPAHALTQALLAAVDRPLAAPSANRSGRLSPTAAAHVVEEVGERVDLVLDAGPCAIGVESTIVAVLPGEPLRVLRPGAVDAARIEALTGERPLVGPCAGAASTAAAASGPGAGDAGTSPQARGSGASPQPTGAPGAATARPPAGTGDLGTPPLAPGQLASHYAPRASVRLGATAAGPDEALLGFGPHAPDGALNLSPRGSTVEAAANLYAMLRRLDATGAPTIAVMPIPDDGLGEAINERLRRAAAPRS